MQREQAACPDSDARPASQVLQASLVASLEKRPASHAAHTALPVPLRRVAKPGPHARHPPAPWADGAYLAAGRR